MYQSTDYDAFGWSPLGVNGDVYGLDYESAREVTPQWYGVSFGNGNDGVSHTFPNYYVRTADPFRLAAVAMLANFNNAGPEDKRRIIDATEIDGERDYGISAMILNPEDIEPEADPEDIECDECGAMNNPGDDSCVQCDADLPEEEDNGSWCDANGAWIICEVFPVDEMPGVLLLTDRVDGRTVEHVQYNPFGNPAYCTLEDCFDAADLELIEK